jgi:hypothetical protein
LVSVNESCHRPVFVKSATEMNAGFHARLAGMRRSERRSEDAPLLFELRETANRECAVTGRRTLGALGEQTPSTPRRRSPDSERAAVRRAHRCGAAVPAGPEPAA